MINLLNDGVERMPVDAKVMDEEAETVLLDVVIKVGFRG